LFGNTIRLQSNLSLSTPAISCRIAPETTRRKTPARAAWRNCSGTPPNPSAEM
jgi:hypothetical protein